MAFTKHILVPTDFSDASKIAVDGAKLLAKSFDAKITLIHVHDPDALRLPTTLGWTSAQQQGLVDEVEEAVKKQLESIREDDLKDVDNLETKIVRDPSAAHAICAQAEELGADLIVLCTHGRTGLKHLLIGSVAERVVRHAPCAVLTLRTSLPD